MSHHDLSNSVRIYQDIREQLQLEYNLLPEDPCLADTLEGITDLHEVIAALVRDAKRTEAMAEALKIIIADNQARKQRFESKGERLRALASWALTEAGIPRIDAPDMTITNANGPPHVQLTVPDNEVPNEFCRIKKTPNKTAIGEELKSGRFVPFAVWSNPKPVLKVHTI